MNSWNYDCKGKDNIWENQVFSESIVLKILRFNQIVLHLNYSNFFALRRGSLNSDFPPSKVGVYSEESPTLLRLKSKPFKTSCFRAFLHSLLWFWKSITYITMRCDAAMLQKESDNSKAQIIFGRINSFSYLCICISD